MFSTECKTKRNECQSRYYQRKLPMLSLFGIFLEKDIFEPGWNRLITVMASCYYWWAGSSDFGKYISGSKDWMCEGMARLDKIRGCCFFMKINGFQETGILIPVWSLISSIFWTRILTLISLSFLFHKIKGVVLTAKILLALKIKWF